MHSYICIHIFSCICIHVYICIWQNTYGVATISRLLKITGLFRKRAL